MHARYFLGVGLLLVLAVVAGCGSGTGAGSNPFPNGSSQVSVSIKDSPPAGVTVLSFEVTVTGATLNPGNVSLVNSPIEIEVKRLETEAALLSTLNVPAGTYTSITVNFSNPELTFKNDTGAPLAGCAAGQVCEIKPNVAGSATFSGAPFPLTISANTQMGLLVDVNLANLISNSLGVDFTAANAIVVTQQAVVGGEIEKIEDVKGQVTAKDAPNNQFTLQTAAGSFTIKVDSNTVFEDFGGVCPSANFACVAVNQIVEVDLSLQGGGTLLAKEVELEDNDVNEAEVEGVIFAVDSTTVFRMVALEETPDIAGLDVGNVITVTLGSGTTFSVDDDGLSTSGFNFSSAADLLVGQNVQVRRQSTSSGTSVNADRVRLKGSRFTATITGTVSASGFTVNNLPSLFTSASPAITQIQVQVSSLTEFEGVSGISGLAASNLVSLRGLLFKNGANPPVLIAGKVIKR